MTDNIHGRDYVIQNIKYIDLSKIKNDKDIYEIYQISQQEINLINETIL
jgi:hypothetical protein